MEDLEKVYDEQIRPLVDQLMRVCGEHKMPYLCVFQTDENKFCSSFSAFDMPLGNEMANRLRGALLLVREGFDSFLQRLGHKNQEKESDA